MLLGGAGHDVIYAYGGADDIDGGEGYDFIDAGTGSDRIVGGLGRDRIEAGLGDDLVFGDLGDGTATLGDDDVIFGGLGNDTIRAGGGADRVHGGFGTDTIFGDDGDDTLFADYGGGTIRGGAGDDIITGADDDADLLFGDAGRDRLFGLAGNDQIAGGAGDDIVDAGRGDDTVEGGLGRDLLIGGFGHDTLYGHQADGLGDDAAPDMLYGDTGAGAAAGDGNDRLFGGAGNDHLFGEGGTDLLNAGAGNSDIADTSENAAYVAGTPTAAPTRVAETRFGAADSVRLPQAVPTQGFWVDLAGPAGLSLVGPGQNAADADGFVQLASGALVRGDGSVIPADYALLLGRGSTVAADGAVRPGDGSAMPGDGAILTPNGASVAFDGQSFADGMVGSSAIAAGAGGQYLAWVDPRGGASEIYVARLSGGVWTPVGASTGNGGISASIAASTAPALALDATGAPVIAWIEATADGRTQVNLARFDSASGQWRALAGSLSAGGISGVGTIDRVDLVSTSSGVVAIWRDNAAGSDRLFAKRFNGTDWVEIGANSASGAGLATSTDLSGGYAIATDGTRVAVAFGAKTGDDRLIVIREFNGTSWATLPAVDGGALAGAERVTGEPSLAYFGGRLYAAWAEQVPGTERLSTDRASQIYVRAYNGTAWVEAGAGSASGRGVSQAVFGAVTPKLAAGTGGMTLTYIRQDFVGAARSLTLDALRWTGTTFAPQLASHVGGAGIATLPVSLAGYDLTVDASGRPFVTWTGAEAGRFGVFVKGSPSAGARVFTADATTSVQSILDSQTLLAGDVIVIADTATVPGFTVTAADSGVTIVASRTGTCPVPSPSMPPVPSRFRA